MVEEVQFSPISVSQMSGVEAEGTQRKILNELLVFRLGSSPFEQLPVEILYLIMEQLDDYSIYILSMTSKHIRKQIKKRRGTDFRCWFNPDWKLTPFVQ